MELSFKRRCSKNKFDRTMLGAANDVPREEVQAVIDRVEAAADNFKYRKCVKKAFVCYGIIIAIVLIGMAVRHARHSRWHKNGPHFGPNGPMARPFGRPQGPNGQQGPQPLMPQNFEHSQQSGRHHMRGQGPNGRGRVLDRTQAPQEENAQRDQRREEHKQRRQARRQRFREWRERRREMREKWMKRMEEMRRNRQNKPVDEASNPIATPVPAPEPMPAEQQQVKETSNEQQKPTEGFSGSSSNSNEKSPRPEGATDGLKPEERPNGPRPKGHRRWHHGMRRRFRMMRHRFRMMRMWMHMKWRKNHRRHRRAKFCFFIILVPLLIGICACIKRKRVFKRVKNILEIENRIFRAKYGKEWAINKKMTDLTLKSCAVLYTPHQAVQMTQHMPHGYPQPMQQNPFIHPVHQAAPLFTEESQPIAQNTHRGGYARVSLDDSSVGYTYK